MIKGTTICAVRRDGMCALAGDGQVTVGETTIMKHSAKKVRRIYNDQVVVGFEGQRGGRVRAMRKIRGQAPAIFRQFAARGGGTGPGLADGQGYAQAGSHAIVRG